MAVSADQWFLNFLVLRDFFTPVKTKDHPHPKFLFIWIISIYTYVRNENWEI